MSFDPNAAAQPGSGIFGLPHSVDEARVVLVPVPFDATTSYGKGAAKGPDAILEASKQVDLYDLDTGRPYEQGIAMLRHSRAVASELKRLNAQATRLARPIIAAGGVSGPALSRNARLIDAASERVNALVHGAARSLIERGKLVGVLGGDHATPFGAIQAHAEKYPGLGVLHLDAHADLRRAFEGFTWSHASIMYNVVDRLPIAKLVQVGIRDFCEEEVELGRRSMGRIVTWFDGELARRGFEGESWSKVCERIVRDLPKDVYISFDIDGLDPALCPHTGTPVPGGLSFQQANALIGAVARSGRRIVGFDLNEVSPGPEGDEWDANVGARVLYKLIGWALASHGASAPGKRRGAR